MTNMFSDLTISNCMLIFILEFIYGWSDCTADFECKEYLPGENQKTDFTLSDVLEIIKVHPCLADKAIHLEQCTYFSACVFS